MPDATSFDCKAALTSHLIAARDILVAPHRLEASDNPVRMGVVAALRSLGAQAQAIPLYDAVLATAPDFQPALIGRVDASMAAGDLQAALSYITAALAVMPGDAALLLKRATALRTLGQTAQDQQVLGALATDPATTLQQKLAVARGLMAVRDFAGADRIFAQVLAKNPKAEPAWIGRADVALAMGDPPLAIARCELGLEQLGANSALQQKLANALQRIGRTDEAIGILQTLLRQAPHSTAVQVALAAALRAVGRSDEAAAIYTAILDLTPSHRGALTAQIEMALLAALWGATFVSIRGRRPRDCAPQGADLAAIGATRRSFCRVVRPAVRRAARIARTSASRARRTGCRGGGRGAGDLYRNPAIRPHQHPSHPGFGRTGRDTRRCRGGDGAAGTAHSGGGLNGPPKTDPARCRSRHRAEIL